MDVLFRCIQTQHQPKSCEIKCIGWGDGGRGGGKRTEHLSSCQDNIATEVIYFFTNEHVSDSHLYVIQVIYD